MKIRKDVLEKVTESRGCRVRLMEALQVSEPTMHRYVTENDDNLTKAIALKVIGEYFNLQQSEILEDEKAAA